MLPLARSLPNETEREPAHLSHSLESVYRAREGASGQFGSFQHAILCTSEHVVKSVVTRQTERAGPPPKIVQSVARDGEAREGINAAIK